MATIYSVIKKNIRDATVKAFELSDIPINPNNIIFSNQNGTEPKGDYCVINILENRQKGRVNESTRTSDGASPEIQQLTSTSFYYAKTQLSFIGNSAYENGLEFESALNNNRQVIEWYQRKSLNPVNKSSVKRLPKLRETDWIESAVIDFDLGYSVQRYQDIDWVEYITINGETFRIVGEELFGFGTPDHTQGWGDSNDENLGGVFYTTGTQ